MSRGGPSTLVMHVIMGEPVVGGVTAHVLSLVPYLAQHGMEVEIASVGAGVGAELAAARGIPTQVVPKNGRGDVLAILRLARLFRRLRPSLVHTHTLSSNFYGRSAARLAGVPCQVTTVHSLMEELLGYDARHGLGNRLLLRYNQRLSRTADRLVAVSDRVRAWLLEWGSPAARVQVIRCGIDLNWRGSRDADRHAARKAWGLSDDHWVIGNVARAHAVKDQAMLLTAAAPLLRDDPSARLVIVGDGPERPRLLARAKAEGVADRVLLPGAVPDAKRLATGFDVFALSSRVEGIPLAMLEAMAVSVPVVVTDVGGVSEVVTDEVSGLLVPAGSAEELRAALLRVRAEPRLASRLGAAGRLFVDEQYDVRVTSDRLAALYREVLAARDQRCIKGQCGKA